MSRSTQSTQTQTNSMSELNVCDVWSNNLKSVMRNVSEMVNQYNYISLDMEYDGMARAVNHIHTSRQYDSIRRDVHQTSVTQIGLSLFNSFGETPQHMSRIQFNLNANSIDSDSHRSGMEAMPTHSSGAQRHQHLSDGNGIDANAFAEEMYNFGLVLADDRAIKWICFDGGLDLAHLLKIITDNALPSTKSEFIEDIRLYFRNTFDIKYMINSFQPSVQQYDLKRMAEVMGIDRNMSSGFIAGTAFFKIRQYIFGNNFDEVKYNSRIFGFD